jgi:hypothetical protein
MPQTKVFADRDYKRGVKKEKEDQIGFEPTPYNIDSEM